MFPKLALGCAIVCATLALSPAPAQAHSWSELNDWLIDWDTRFEAAWTVASRGLAPLEDPDDLIAEYEDMRARHPDWDGKLIPAPTPVDTHSHASGSVSSPPSAGSSAPVSSPPEPPTVASGVEQWRSLVSSYSWNADIALCLMGYESGGNPNAYNSRSGASGLMQVLASWADNFGYVPSDLFIPEVNISIAYALYVDGGWNHWSPWKRGLCH